MTEIQASLFSEKSAVTAQALIAEAIELSAEYEHEVASAIERAASEPLDDVTAYRMFSRILVILRVGAHADDATKARVAAEVEREVQELVLSRVRPTNESPTGITLQARHGLQPHAVIPAPIFNGVQIALEEGYIDVSTLGLWKENARVDLHVREFKERFGRSPDENELLMLVQGRLEQLTFSHADPFEIIPLARSIARKGVERPPIVTHEGQPKDGNRRIAAARHILASKDFTPDQKERARWIRVWKAPAYTTDDQFEAIVVALNFEADHKQPWPEYVKARLVVDRYRTQREDYGGRIPSAEDKRIRDEVAKHYAITAAEVTRYNKMVRWAEDFEQYHIGDRGLDDAAVRYKANEIFQWFYEIDAGKGADKLTIKLEQDEELRPVVYDLMYEILESGLQVRNLHRVIGDEVAFGLLKQAHEAAAADPDQALTLVRDAIAEAQRNAPSKKLGFDQWLRTAAQRLDHASPKDWHSVADDQLLRDLTRVLQSASSAAHSELEARLWVQEPLA